MKHITRQTKTRKPKVYKTKKVKTQILYWKILTGSMFLAVIIMGAVGTHTNKVMSAEPSTVTVPRPELLIEEVKAPETLKEMVNRVAKEENFPYVSYIYKLIDCESKWNPNALNINNKGLGIDLGLLQLNTKYNPTISMKDMLDPEFSTRYAMREILAGRQSRWVCDGLVKNK